MTKQFRLTGTVIDNDAIERLRPQWESLLEDELAQRGFKRALEHDTVFITKHAEVGFEWELYMQGVYAGKQALSPSSQVSTPTPNSK